MMKHTLLELGAVRWISAVRRSRQFPAAAWMMAGIVLSACLGVARTAAIHPLENPGEWVVEQQPGGTVTVANGVLMIDSPQGCTVWWAEALAAPVEIRFVATVVVEGGPNDRLSDLNCFWMASDPAQPGRLLAPGHSRTGAFADYDQLQLYYVGYGGNENTTTRFRRYRGDGSKPLLPEHDLREPGYLLKANHAYEIRLVALADGTVEYYRDGERIFHFVDPQPLMRGWFGFRTVSSRIRVTEFAVRSVE